MKKLDHAQQLQRIWDNIEHLAPDECWPWRGRWVSAQGYGLVKLDGRCTTTHRALYLLTKKIVDRAHAIPVVRHTCDNPICCNPAHLLAGSYRDNSQDCIERDRRAKRHRPHTRVKKLTDDQVRAIRRDIRPLNVIAVEHGISESVVSMVRRRKSKALVPD